MPYTRKKLQILLFLHLLRTVKQSYTGQHKSDLGRGRAIELYTYETDPSAQIVSFKFKDPESVREEDDDEEIGEYKEKLGMSLGLGINTADKGVVVELQLTVAGDVAREENSICVYEDPDQPIGKIVDISYNYE